jgi:WD40 repeat protein
MSLRLLASILAFLGAGCGSPFGDLMAAGDKAKDAAPGEVRRFELPNYEVVYCVAFSPDGRKVIAGTAGGRLWLWDADKGKAPQQFKATSDDLLRGGVLSLAFSPDGKRILLGCADNSVRLWDLDSGKTKHLFEGHNSRVTGSHFTLDGKQIVSASIGEVRVWDVKTGKTLSKFEVGDLYVEGVALSPDGGRVLLGGINELQLWDVQAGKLLKRIENLDGKVRVVFSPDGRYALSGEMWGSVRLWELPKSESGKRN